MDPKKQRLILGILMAVAIIVWIRNLTVKPVRSHRPASVSPTVLPSPSSVAPVPSSPQMSRYTEWGGNPFEIERRTTPTLSATTPGGHTLSGILWDPKAPSAVIDNQLVSVGDKLNSWEVVEIHKEEVILSDGLTTQTLKVQ